MLSYFPCDSRRTAGTSRTYPAFPHLLIPTRPSFPAVYNPKEKVKENSDKVDINLNPRQTAGTLTLSPEDIRDRNKMEKKR